MRTTPRGLVDDVRADIRYAARSLLRSPGFFVAALSLGAAVGAVTAVQSTVDWLLDRSPTGVVEPERLVAMRLTEQGREGERYATFAFSVPQYEALRDIQDAFVDVAAYGKLPMIASGDDWQDRLVFQYVSGSYFPLLGMRPHIGRVLGPDDDVEGAVAAVVLSHTMWQSRYGGDPDVLGRAIRLQSGEGRIVGVLPARYEDYSLDWNAPTDLWLPLHAGAHQTDMEIMLTSPSTFFPILGRLRPGVSADEAHARAQRWVTELPPVRTTIEANAIYVGPERELRISRRDEAEAFLTALLAVGSLILCAAAFNVVNFFLGRAARRRREIALRSALGADRPRLVRQLVTEASLMAAATSGTAMIVGSLVVSVLGRLPNVYLDVPAVISPITTTGALDLRMLAGAAALGGVAAFATGVLPMLASFGDPMVAIKGTAPGWSWSRFRPTLRQGVLMLQVGLAVAMSVTAGLYAQGFRHAAAADPEYAEPETLLIARVSSAVGRTVDRAPSMTSLTEQIEAAPWSVSVALSYNRPYAGGFGTAALPADPEAKFRVDGAVATPGLFDTFGVPLAAGREFEEGDHETEAVIINRTLAERLWPGVDPIGQSFVYTDAPARVVGVVARERCADLLAAPDGCVWRPIMSAGGGTINVRTAGPAEAAIPALRALVTETDPTMVVVEAESLASFLDGRVRAERTAAIVSSGLALFGVLLLAVGCVSLFLSMVRESLREIAIRMALGATSSRVTSVIMTQGLLVTGVGVVVGVCVAGIVATRLAGQFYGIVPIHPPTFVIVSVMVLLISLVSVGYTAVVATRTDPATHLHMD